MNALCNLSRKKSREVAASLPGRFLSRNCFTLCITIELRSSTNASIVAVAKITRDWGWRVGNMCLCVVFWLTRRSRVRGEKMCLGASYSTSNKLFACCQTHSVLRACKNVFKVGRVKFANSLSPPSIVKKVRTGSKSSQGT